MTLPDYRGGSIVNLMASLQAGLGGPDHAYRETDLLPAQRLSEYRQVLLLVIDGLGLNYLRANPEAVCLNAHLRAGLTSVFPPTTATAVTTYLTGDAPQQHGLTGWHMYLRELGCVLAVLPGRTRYGGVGLSQAGIDVGRLFGHVAFSERIRVPAHTVSPGHIAESDFNLAHLGRAHLHAYSGLAEMFDSLARLLRTPGPKFIHAYWPELDTLGHHHGIWSGTARDHLLELDRAFERFLVEISGTETLVVVTADHGQIDTRPGDRICLDDHPGLAETLALPLCGEPRAAYCYLRPGFEAQFDDYVGSELANVASAVTGRSLIEAGWFGLDEPHPRLEQRVGDRVLLMKGNYLIKDWLAQERRFELIGVHGGLSADELLVPCILAEG